MTDLIGRINDDMVHYLCEHAVGFEREKSDVNMVKERLKKGMQILA